MGSCKDAASSLKRSRLKRAEGSTPLLLQLHVQRTRSLARCFFLTNVMHADSEVKKLSTVSTALCG